jgi:malate/lactate dehydrogenase
LKGNRAIGTPKILTIGVISGDQIIPLISSKEITGIRIGMIKKSKPLSKITYSLMRKERKEKLILKFIVLVTPLHPLI